MEHGQLKGNFPPDDIPVNLFSMPAAYYGDIDHDKKKDLLVSPFDPNPVISENYNSVWFYKNMGDDQNGLFHLQKTAFLQEDMIDAGAGAYPVFFDYDGDGLQDLFIGNYGRYDTSFYDQYMILHTKHTGRVALFRNTGNASQPTFTLITDDFAGMGSLEIVPVEVDIIPVANSQQVIFRRPFRSQNFVVMVGGKPGL